MNDFVFVIASGLLLIGVLALCFLASSKRANESDQEFHEDKQ